MKHVVLSLLIITGLLANPTYTSAQGLVQSGGEIVINQGAHLVIDGTGNYYDTLGGRIQVVSQGYMYLPGNWTNSSGAEVFSTNFGEVQFIGGIQRIRGANATSFPTLDLKGTGNKWMDVDALVGGGHSGGGNGILKCNDRLLILNSQQLVVNNESNGAITRGLGGIVSETDPTSGYGRVQWNIRDNPGLYSIPFSTLSSQPVPYVFNVQSAGLSLVDSGYVRASTYPTNTAAAVNNRQLPTSVTNTLNEYGRENAMSLADRFWIVNTGLYGTTPTGVPTYGYLDAEHDASGGSTNIIVESNLRPLEYDLTSNSWIYPGTGGNNATANRAVGGNGDFDGIFVLSDTTICPVAFFVWDGNCEDDPIFFTDQTTLSRGLIESWAWDFADGSTSANQNPANTFSPAGNYDVRLIVIGPTGCPDTVNSIVTIDTRAVADFIVGNNLYVGLGVQFTDNSSNANDWFWDFGDFESDNAQNPKHIYAENGSYEVILIAGNQANCPDTMVKFISIEDPDLFLIPSAFSPGTKDDLNRSFGLQTIQVVKEYDMRIYNRWGEQIFESVSVDEKWNGDYQGKPVMAGSYLYTVYFRDATLKAHYFKGMVTVLK